MSGWLVERLAGWLVEWLAGAPASIGSFAPLNIFRCTKMIPKVVHQTWKTHRLPRVSQLARQRMQTKNPAYSFELYDDNDIEDFLRANFDETVRVAYSRLQLGASRADFFRYCVLYIRGGVYVDIDSEITGDLDSLLELQRLHIQEENSECCCSGCWLSKPAIRFSASFFMSWTTLSRPSTTPDPRRQPDGSEDLPRPCRLSVCKTCGIWPTLTSSTTLRQASNDQMRRTKAFGYDGNYAVFKVPLWAGIHVENMLHGTIHWKMHEWWHDNTSFVQGMSVVAAVLAIPCLCKAGSGHTPALDSLRRPAAG